MALLRDPLTMVRRNKKGAFVVATGSRLMMCWKGADDLLSDGVRII